MWLVSKCDLIPLQQNYGFFINKNIIVVLPSIHIVVKII